MDVVRLSTSSHAGKRKVHLGMRNDERETAAARAGESR
jgi:hypothetical protein